MTDGPTARAVIAYLDALNEHDADAIAACVAEDGTSVRYDSGPGGPWADSCQVPVRLEGQDDWTYLSVPIVVNALDPQPVLRAGSMTVGPGVGNGTRTATHTVYGRMPALQDALPGDYLDTLVLTLTY